MDAPIVDQAYQAASAAPSIPTSPHAISPHTPPYLGLNPASKPFVSGQRNPQQHPQPHNLSRNNSNTPSGFQQALHSSKEAPPHGFVPQQRGQQQQAAAGGGRGGAATPTDPSAAQLLGLDTNDTLIIVDPASRKIALPRSLILETKATQRLGVPSLCMLFQEGRCRQGVMCHQVHADPTLIAGIRENARQFLHCCAAHGEPTPTPVAWRNFAVNFVGGTATNIPLSQTAMTTGLMRMIESQIAHAGNVDGQRLVFPVSVQQICRLHGQDRCRFSEDCKFLHLCKDLLWNELGAANALGERKTPFASSSSSVGPSAPNTPSASYRSPAFANTPNAAANHANHHHHAIQGSAHATHPQPQFQHILTNEHGLAHPQLQHPQQPHSPPHAHHGARGPFGRQHAPPHHHYNPAGGSLHPLVGLVATDCAGGTPPEGPLTPLLESSSIMSGGGSVVSPDLVSRSGDSWSYNPYSWKCFPGPTEALSTYA